MANLNSCHRLQIPVIVLAMMASSGCDILLDNALDCIDSDGPQFDKSTLITPVLNQEYQEIITVRIENEPRDDRFIYAIQRQGSLPAGMTGEQVPENGRRYFLGGTPTELGTFSFTLFVAVEEPGVGDSLNSGLCYTTRSRTFEFTVNPT